MIVYSIIDNLTYPFIHILFLPSTPRYTLCITIAESLSTTDSSSASLHKHKNSK